jgi:AraC-like DNA-binding protein/mannose-6-phosphate isomerase-like protein (cupin superfamily)
MEGSTGTLVGAEALFEAVLAEMVAQKKAGGLFYASATAVPHPDTVGLPSLHKHISDGHEFAFVTRGCAKVVTPKTIYDLSPGVLLLIGRGVEHDESPADDPEPYVMNWCYADHTYARLDQTEYNPPQSWRMGPSVELMGRTEVESISAAIGAEIEHRDYGWERSVSGLLNYLSCILIRRLRRGSVVRLRSGESPTISADPRTWRVIQTALQFCESNFRKPLSLSDVSAAVGYSPSHLSRLISTHLGHSLSDHIRDLRIQAGKQLLESSDLAIGEIARQLGYGDPSHFSHAFSRAVGVSPKSFRERLKGL